MSTEQAAPWSTRASVLAGRAWDHAMRIWNGIPLAEPWRVLVPLLGVHWVALVLFALSVDHNGWLFYQGGDQIWSWTVAWLLGHGSIMWPLVAHGWGLLLTPLALIAGPAYVNALPGIVLLQVLVIAPLALWCVYDLAARIGGRVIGYLAALLWTLGPYLAIPFFADRYHEKYVEWFLPHPLGLTAMADYTGTVLLIAAAAFTVRSFQGRDPTAAIIAGLAAGYAGVVKPSNLIFLAAPVVVLLCWLRWRELLAFAAGIALPLGALTLWKYQGYGYVPAFALEQTRLAAGADTLVEPYHRYVDIDWHHFHVNTLQLGEVFWSMRLLEWAPLAGAIAVARRSLPTALFLSIWFWGFLIVKGADEVASVENASFFRLLLPGFPPLLVMVAALPLLFPRAPNKLANRFRAPARPVPRAAIAVAVVALGVVPLAAAAVVSPLKGPDRWLQLFGIGVPVEANLDLDGRVQNGTVRLTWQKAETRGSRIFYKVLRAPGPSDVTCFASSGGADNCVAEPSVVSATRGLRVADRPGAGTWTYRLGVGANYLNDPAGGDIFLVSRPITVRVPESS